MNYITLFNPLQVQNNKKMKTSKSNYKSSSGRSYEIEGNIQSGYRATDKQNNERSVYCADSANEMKNLIEDVEQGNRQDAGNFGKHDR